MVNLTAAYPRPAQTACGTPRVPDPRNCPIARSPTSTPHAATLSGRSVRSNDYSLLWNQLADFSALKDSFNRTARMTDPEHTYLYTGTDTERANRLKAKAIDLQVHGGDLGLGLYTTPSKWEAIEWAQRAAGLSRRRAALVRFKIQTESFTALRGFHFTDEDELFRFVRETAGHGQLRYRHFDYLTSSVRLPISDKIGLQVKFQSDSASQALAEASREVLLFPPHWGAGDFLSQHYAGGHRAKEQTDPTEPPQE